MVGLRPGFHGRADDGSATLAWAFPSAGNVDANTVAYSDAGAPSGPHTGADAVTNAVTDPVADAHAISDAVANAVTNADTNTQAGADAYADTGAGGDVHAGAGGSRLVTDANAHAIADKGDARPDTVADAHA